MGLRYLVEAITLEAIANQRSANATRGRLHDESHPMVCHDRIPDTQPLDPREAYFERCVGRVETWAWSYPGGVDVFYRLCFCDCGEVALMGGRRERIDGYRAEVEKIKAKNVTPAKATGKE